MFLGAVITVKVLRVHESAFYSDAIVGANGVSAYGRHAGYLLARLKLPKSNCADVSARK